MGRKKKQPNEPERFPRENPRSEILQIGGDRVETETNNAQKPRRRNATGPRTPQGKQISKMNAVKHGAFPRVLLSGESEQEFEKFRKAWWEDRKPLGAAEESVVDELVWIDWRKGRLRIAERAEILRKVDSLRLEIQQKQEEELEAATKTAEVRVEGLLTDSKKRRNPLILERGIELLKTLRKRSDTIGFGGEENENLLAHIYGGGECAEPTQKVVSLYLRKEDSARILHEAREEGKLKESEESTDQEEGDEDAEGEELEELEDEDEEEEDDEPVQAPDHIKEPVLEAIDEDIKRLEDMKAKVDYEQQRLLVRQAEASMVPDERFMRYETMLNREFDRKLTQLERLQRRRMGEKDLPPVKVDVSS